MSVDDRFQAAMTEIREQREALRAAEGSSILHSGGGGGTSGGMDGWQQSVEARLGRLDDKIDNRMLWILGAFAAGFILLGGLVLNRTDALAAKIDASTERLAAQIADLKVAQARIEATSDRSPASPATAQP